VTCGVDAAAISFDRAARATTAFNLNYWGIVQQYGERRMLRAAGGVVEPTAQPLQLQLWE
jgi:hypothetical protein